MQNSDICVSVENEIYSVNKAEVMCRDQPNSRFHGRDIFREIGLLP